MSEKAMNLCYKCVYRGESPGSAHSTCNHPACQVSKSNINSMLALLASVGRAEPVDGGAAKTQLGIKASAHGIRSGWFNWPYDFDPVWLENCEGFEPKEEEL